MGDAAPQSGVLILQFFGVQREKVALPNDFATADVPPVDAAVAADRNEALSAIPEYQRVHVAGVSGELAQFLARGHFPEDDLVPCGGRDRLAVGRETDKTGAVTQVVLQEAQGFAGRGVPEPCLDADLVAEGSGDDRLPVVGPVDAADTRTK